MSPHNIRDEAQRLHDQHGLALLVIDDVHLMRWQTKKGDLPLSEIFYSLKLIAREFNVPVIVTARLSADIERREDTTLRLSDLLECDPLEDADVVLALQEVKGHGPASTGLFTDVVCLKNRNSPPGSVRIERTADGAFRWHDPAAGRLA